MILRPLTRTEVRADPDLVERLGRLTRYPELPNSDMWGFLHGHDGWVGDAVLAEDGGEVVGWASVFGLQSDRMCVDVFVEPSRRRQGIGRRLVEALLSAHDRQGRTLLFSDVPFFRHLVPDAEPVVRCGIPILTRQRVQEPAAPA